METRRRVLDRADRSRIVEPLAARRTTAGCTGGRALRPAHASSEVAAASGSTRGSSTRSPLVRAAAEIAAAGARRAAAAPGQAAGCPTGQLAALRPDWPARTVSARCATGWGSGRCTRPSTPARRVRRATPYHYSRTTTETEVAPSDRPKVLILGSGPNRIGQGIEFDYSLRARVDGAARRRATRP
jgi:carbamoyl-phosphate synthase large subunit